MEINPQEHKPDPPPVKKKSSAGRLIILVLLAGAAATAAWYYLQPAGQHKGGRVQSISTTGARSTKPIIHNRQEYQTISAQQAARAQTARQESKPELKIPAQQPQSSPEEQCRQLTDRLLTFFDHLDHEQYIENFNLGMPTREYFSLLAAKLLGNPPTVTRESDDLYTILTNMAHFFRIIGRKNILLMKSILDRERDKIEDVAADLYRWSIVRRCTDDEFQLKAPLEEVYEYAGFFLNTMGGRSYLFRRDSRSRLLVNYYAILIVDRANKENLNRYGIDLKPIIPKLIQEIEATNQLIYKEDYLDRLTALQEKYAAMR